MVFVTYNYKFDRRKYYYSVIINKKFYNINTSDRVDIYREEIV